MKKAEVAGRSPEMGKSSRAKKPAAADPAAEQEAKFAEILDTVDAGAKRPAKGAKQERIVAFLDESPKKKTNGAGVTKKSAQKRAKARKPHEKLTPASIYRKMISFGKSYQIDGEQDFQEAARIYAEEAGLIDQMRDRLAEDGLTVLKTYKTGDVEVAHPLLSELPRHVESANKCLATIGSMISERGARVEKAKRDLDAFRMNA